MRQLDVHAADWYQAVTLSERLSTLKTAPTARSQPAIDPALAQRRLERWKAPAPFNQEEYFAQRLASEHLTEEVLWTLLGEPAEAVRDRLPHPPAWLAGLADAFAREPEAAPLPLSEAVRRSESAGFLEIVAPLIRQGRAHLDASIRALQQVYAPVPWHPDTVAELFMTALARQLLTMVSRTLVLELHVARLRGLLPGETPEERFDSFLQRLRQRDVALGILQEYPVLARQLLLGVERWVACSLEFLQHLAHDWAAMRARLTPDHDPGVLTAVSSGAGDTHRDGRSVMIATFQTGFRVVYKPRPLSLDVHFQALLRWLNAHGDHPPFRSLTILDCGAYGWVEYVTAQPCATEEEVRRFYARQGGYLALLYALEAVDFHHENLIAVGEQPLLVDLEALFHPRLGGGDLTQAEQLATSTLGYSVYGTGLLPRRLWATEESEGIDVSGLGAAGGQLTPYDVPYWAGVGTDAMQLSRRRVEVPGEQNRPTLNGASVEVLDYAAALAGGFTSLYRLLWEHRDALLAEDGPLAHFANDAVRVIVRPTHTYATLLTESFHPDVLRHALDRDRLLDRLWAGVVSAPYLARLIPAEREDLLKGDIPLFTTHPASTDLWTSTGQRLPDVLPEPGLASVHRRLRQFSEADLARQLWIIRTSLTALAPHLGGSGARVAYGLTAPPPAADRPRLLAAAGAVGDRLEALALYGRQDVSWLGVTFVNERHWSLAPLGYDLYDGLPGVTLFLAYLGAVTQEERYTRLARAALATLQRHVEVKQAWITQVGGFSGWGGLLYTLMHLATLWRQPELIAQAERWVALLPPLIAADTHYDVISGAAGCLGSLLSLYRCHPAPDTLAVAVQCGEHLLAQAQAMESGCGWAIRGVGSRPLAGLSHGSAGMAWVLLDLAALTGEERFRATALDAMAYERSLFAPAVRNWPDLRRVGEAGRAGSEARASFMTAWCHGAPGIGLARLQALKHLDGPEIRAEIDAALTTTLAQGFGGNHSLCHGDLGNLELLWQASAVLGEAQWRVQGERLAACILENIAQHGWRCGVPGEVESPGLMTGLAGIGFGLLRCAEPTRVPAVLVLAPPPQSYQGQG